MEIKLTQTQSLAVTARGKNILISAGAGTGKTRVLVERFLNYVQQGDALVTEILALTFTEKAANEMKSRILERFEKLGMQTARRDLEVAYISTIHAFAARVLREHPIEAGVDPEFRVMEGDESVFVREQILDQQFEKLCQPESLIFEFVQTYGEAKVREGILKVYDHARGDGMTLKTFFECSSENRVAAESDFSDPVFDGLEDGLEDEWRKFMTFKKWGWQEIEAFKEWFGKFSRKRDKKNQTTWKDFREAAKKWVAMKIDHLGERWREPFQLMAFHFEEAYDAQKREQGLLDFDDLQILTIRLFESQNPAHKNIVESYRKRFRQIMVDEFQDTNALQLKLVELLAGDKNLFYVGDFKQSIYGFRGADPDLFLEKQKEYSEKEDHLRISLTDNFRTQGETLEKINRLFKDLWQEDDVDFEPLTYIESAKKEGASFEIMPLEQKEDENVAQLRMREADQIAERMIQFRKEGIDFGGMAILFQAMTDVALYENALKRRGIPYYALSSRGFYHQPEIRDILSYLLFIDNPLADIPLAAALRSPLFQIDDNGLVWLAQKAKDLKEKNNKKGLYHAVLEFSSIEYIEEEQKQKLEFFLRTSEEIFQLKERLRLSELIDTILEKTSYELVALGNPQGIRRYANLKKLVYLAREVENFELFSLSKFLKTIERLEVQEVREAEAQVEAEESNHVVRLLSVHRSKGLEFPVVFLADCGRSKSAGDSKVILAGSKQGYTLQVRNEITYEWEKPWSWLKLNDELMLLERKEWKRLFYVAVTRTKGRLILSGALKTKNEKESYYEMSSWMEWIASSSVYDALSQWEESTTDNIYLRQVIGESKDWRGLLEMNEALNVKDIEMIQPILDRIESAEKNPSRVIDIPVSGYALFSKSPKDYWRTYEIGYPSQAPEEMKEIDLEKKRYGD
jgi:ATP-dependent helicase/nuclease subunit A